MDSYCRGNNTPNDKLRKLYDEVIEELINFKSKGFFEGAVCEPKAVMPPPRA
jgi:hypothetical protein